MQVVDKLAGASQYKCGKTDVNDLLQSARLPFVFTYYSFILRPHPSTLFDTIVFVVMRSQATPEINPYKISDKLKQDIKIYHGWGKVK